MSSWVSTITAAFGFVGGNEWSLKKRFCKCPEKANIYICTLVVQHICWTTSVRSYPMICGRMSIRCVYSFLRIRCFRHKCSVYIRIAQVLHTIVFTCAAHSISAVGPSSNLAQRADSRMSCACIICRLESHHSKTFSTARC